MIAPPPFPLYYVNSNGSNSSASAGWHRKRKNSRGAGRIASRSSVKSNSFICTSVYASVIDEIRYNMECQSCKFWTRNNNSYVSGQCHVDITPKQTNELYFCVKFEQKEDDMKKFGQKEDDLNIELKELSKRVDELQNFMSTSDYQLLPTLQRSLLAIQLPIMISYKRILQERLMTI